MADEVVRALNENRARIVYMPFYVNFMPLLRVFPILVADVARLVRVMILGFFLSLLLNEGEEGVFLESRLTSKVSAASLDNRCERGDANLDGTRWKSKRTMIGGVCIRND